jgi:putrescine transport system permease protein
MAGAASPFRRLGAPPLAWAALFVVAPVLVVLTVSLTEAQSFQALLATRDWRELNLPALDGYRIVLGDPLYRRAAVSSLRIAGLSALLAVAVAYPLAYVVSRRREPARSLLAAAVMLPFWTSFLLRVYAFEVLLGGSGPLNRLLLASGLIAEPLALLHTDAAAVVGIAYSYLPFAFLPIFAGLVRLDGALLEAAADLGAGPVSRFFSIVLPLSAPSLVAGLLLVFIPALGEFVIPDLLGGPDTLTFGRSLWTEFFGNRDWPVASALAVVLLLAAGLGLLAPAIRRRAG